MDAIIQKHLGNNVPIERKDHIKEMMKQAMIDYRWDFDEFFIFHFEKYDDEKRRSFIPEFDKNVFADMVNDKSQADVFLDKCTTYEYFKDFFGRDVCNIRQLKDFESYEFLFFVTKHSSFIMKPAYGTRGEGIKIINAKSAIEAKEILVGLYRSGVTTMILEELIIQNDRLALLHPESTNTLRVVTIRYDDRVEILRSYLRIGKGRSVIDNASAGGILCIVDNETGKISAACDKLGNTFEKHPDTGLKLIGFRIPLWNNVIELVKKTAQVLPKVRYVGWDVAITNTDCVLIEGNDKAQCGFQIPNQEGFRDEMNKILREFGKKEIK